MNKAIFSALVVILFPAGAMADGGANVVRLHDAENDAIEVGYNLTQQQATDEIASAVTVTVTNSAFTGHEAVRAVFIPYFFTDALAQGTPQTIDLTYANGKFAANLGFSFLIERHTTIGVQGIQGVQEIAVVVDGNWLQDPVTGKSNFRLDMFRQAMGEPGDFRMIDGIFY